MKFQHSYRGLGTAFYQTVEPSKPYQPELFLWNAELASQLAGCEEISPTDAAHYFSGSVLPDSSHSIALAYAGHQFGHFNPQLGDGRAHLLGELVNKDGQALDVQLKGSGRTMFSRQGDGRCALKPAVREFIMSEALYALGVPTTRCLSVVATGERVYRQTPQPGAVVCRVASSHIRVGTFQYFAVKRDLESLSRLLDYAIDRHFPHIDKGSDEKALQFLDAVIERQIELVCHWMRIGFIHGVMNTDNTTVSGETIDFGPCAMMGIYDPKTVYSSIDEQGRYAFGNQPSIIQWNMTRLAEALIQLTPTENEIGKFQQFINGFSERFESRYFSMYRSKIGLSTCVESDEDLILKLLNCMQENRLDYTQTFNRLADALITNNNEMLPSGLMDWFELWVMRIENGEPSKQNAVALMKTVNPVVIPRNHHVEKVLEDCESELNGVSAEQFLKVLRSPYCEMLETGKFQDTPSDNDVGYQTFCGT